MFRLGLEVANDMLKRDGRMLYKTIADIFDQFFSFFFVCVCVCVLFLGLHLLWHMEVPRLGVESEL